MASALPPDQTDGSIEVTATGDGTSLTPRNSGAFDDSHDDSPQTPTRHSFCGVPGQRPLPDQPLTSPGGLAAVVRSHLKDIDDDIDMVDADEDAVVEDELSDNDSVTSESQRPSKKKKGQRFFCTDFPPCQLSFTRSEHLARHIRKHTGERPFQCHCSRRFSRLDNLRQHAQTVHVNEDIPGDSLAATSTRFQRQVRTDRVRPTGGRPRTSTLNSTQGLPPYRGGHSRNMSTSSIASTTSTFSINDDSRMRQPQLAIATDSNKRPAGVFDEYNRPSYDTSPHSAHHHHHHSGSGFGTPTSQMYPVGNSGYASGYATPSSVVSRSSYYQPHHTRRLSVPSSSNPYQSNPYSAGQFTPTSMHGSLYSDTPSGFASPTSSIFSPSRMESESEIEFRRRTWHPNTQSNYAQRPATSGLSYHQTPDEDRPALSQQPAATQLTRLPGIESFDQIPPLPVRQPASPSTAEQPLRLLDHALHQGLHRLEISANSPSTQDRTWSRPDTSPSDRALPTLGRAAPTLQSMQPVHHMHHMSMPEPQTTPKRAKRQAWYGGPIGSLPSLSQPAYTSSARPSPEDSASSDGVATPAVAPSYEHHPVIVNHNEPHAPTLMTVDEKPTVYDPHNRATIPQENHHKPALPTRADSGFQSFRPAYPLAQAPPMPTTSDPYAFRLQAGHDPKLASAPPHQHAADGANDMGRLEALVAVATSENRVNETPS